MKHTFTKENTNIVKGIAILLIVCHHVFWDYFFSDGRAQKFFISDLTKFFTRWGFCCNHVFSAITGYGIAALERNNRPTKLFLHREISLLSAFVPIYIAASIVYTMSGGGSGLLQHLFSRKSLENGNKPNVGHARLGRCIQNESIESDLVVF